MQHPRQRSDWSKNTTSYLRPFRPSPSGPAPAPPSTIAAPVTLPLPRSADRPPAVSSKAAAAAAAPRPRPASTSPAGALPASPPPRATPEGRRSSRPSAALCSKSPVPCPLSPCLGAAEDGRFRPPLLELEGGGSVEALASSSPCDAYSETQRSRGRGVIGGLVCLGNAAPHR